MFSDIPHSECHVYAPWTFLILVDECYLLHPKHGQLVDDHSTLDDKKKKNQSSSDRPGMFVKVRGGGGGGIKRVIDF